MAVSVEEAASMARRQYLQVEGIVAVSHIGNTLIFYVETEADRAKAPTSFMGYPVQVKVVGRIGVVR